MDFYFVYSSGGGAGDWNGVDRMFIQHMPPYFKDHILLKFGDIFFNHRSLSSIIKPSLWRNINNARNWIVGNTNDNTLLTTPNMIMDVGTTKIVSYLSANNQANTINNLVRGFDSILYNQNVLQKYCEIILNSNINNAVTFDIPNLFKVRSQIGGVSRAVYTGTNRLLIEASARYANEIYHGVGDQTKLLTTVSGSWTDDDIIFFMSQLDYTPSKLGIGGLSDLRDVDLFSSRIREIDRLLDFSNYSRVHFLGCGGLKKVAAIKTTLGNMNNFSVDNTTPYNRSIDGSKDGSSQSCYYDYATKRMYRISPTTRATILNLHRNSENIACFNLNEMTDIIDKILLHQSNQTSTNTFNARGKLIMHNFDVFRHHAQ